MCEIQDHNFTFITDLRFTHAYPSPWPMVGRVLAVVTGVVYDIHFNDQDLDKCMERCVIYIKKMDKSFLLV